jgi:hypothetical protein
MIGVLDITCDKVGLETDRWFSSGTPVSSTNTTECHDITEILLKVALNTIIQCPYIIGIDNSGKIANFIAIESRAGMFIFDKTNTTRGSAENC